MTIRLPSEDELNEVAELVAGPGVKFVTLGPDQRAMVLKIAIQADINDSVASIMNDTGHMANWFEKSKLWEGRID